MLKKLLVFNLFLIAVLIGAVNVFAADPWGVFDDYEDDYESYALYKVLNNTPIRYAIEIVEYEDDDEDYDDDYENVANDLRGVLEEQKKAEEFKTLIEKAFNTWPTDTRNMIIEEGREEEFADILNILPRKILLKRVSNRDDADIVFIFSAKEDMDCPSTAVACIHLKKDPIETYLQDVYIKENNISKDKLLSDIIHELGHYFALVDQYKDDSGTSEVHSTFSRLKKYDSIMASQNSTHLACDDVDGFINLLDLSVEEFSDRAKDGWESFCNGKKNGKGELFKDEFYREAKLVNKPSHVNGLYTQTFDKNGNLAEDFALDPFDLYGKEVTPSVVGYGLPRDMVDKQNNRKYHYTYNDIEKGEIKIWDVSDKLDWPTYKYIRKNEGDVEWSFDWNSDIYVHFQVNYDYDNQCSLHNYVWAIRGGDKDLTMTIYYTNDDNFSSITYEVRDVSRIDRNTKAKYPIYINLALEGKKYSCFIQEDITEPYFIELELRNSNNIKIIEKDEERLNNFARKYNVPKDEIIENAYKFCNYVKEEGNKEKYKHKCKLFRKVEEFYHSRVDHT